MADGRAGSSSSRPPIGLARRCSSTTHYWLPPDEDALGVGPATTASITAGAAAALDASAAAVTAGQEDSAAESEDSSTFSSGSPDLRQGLLRHAHASDAPPPSQQQRGRRGRGRSRQRHAMHSSPLGSDHQQQQQYHQQRQPQASAGSSSGGVGLLSGLFRGSSRSNGTGVQQQQQQQQDGTATDLASIVIDPAAIDLLAGGGSLTFAGRAAGSRSRNAAAAAGAGPPPNTGGGEASADELRAAAAASAGSSRRTSRFNDEVFNGRLASGSDAVDGAEHSGSSAPQLGPHLGPHDSRGKLRWQAAAQKILAVKHITSTFRPGALQGLDVKRHSYDSMFSLLHTEADITVVDLSCEQVEVAANITNAMLPEFLKVARPEWSRVRWINVQGLSWDVITSLAVAFDLHPLSVEDIVHIPQRIKADYYPEYLFASVLLLSVDHPSQLSSEHHPSSPKPASSKQQQQRRASGSGGPSSSSTAAPPASSRAGRMRARLFGGGGPKAAAINKRQQHTEGASQLLQPMQPMVEQVSLFLFKDGTLITMFQSVEADSIARRLLTKLEGCRSLLTDSEDASYLFNAVLDAVVDHTLPLVQVYSSRIASLESAVLLEARPQASLTKELHLLSNDLKLLRRTLVPTQHLVHKLQNNSQGYLSQLTVLYLSDVYDHISTVVEDMESLAEDAKDLIDLIFNTIAHNNNASMQMLAVVSTIFLPITFLAGVYGTNFALLPELHWHLGYLYFWGLCVFITALFAALLARWGMFDSNSPNAARHHVARKRAD